MCARAGKAALPELAAQWWQRECCWQGSVASFKLRARHSNKLAGAKIARGGRLCATRATRETETLMMMMMMVRFRPPSLSHQAGWIYARATGNPSKPASHRHRHHHIQSALSVVISGATTSAAMAANPETASRCQRERVVGKEEANAGEVCCWQVR